MSTAPKGGAPTAPKGGAQRRAHARSLRVWTLCLPADAQSAVKMTPESSRRVLTSASLEGKSGESILQKSSKEVAWLILKKVLSAAELDSTISSNESYVDWTEELPPSSSPSSPPHSAAHSNTRRLQWQQHSPVAIEQQQQPEGWQWVGCKEGVWVFISLDE